MVNFKEIVQLNGTKEEDFSEGIVLPMQDDAETSQTARKINIKVLAEFIGRVLQFLPNKTTKRETTSVGVQNDASVAVVNRAVLDMSGDSSIKTLHSASLDMSGVSGIKMIEGSKLEMSGSTSIKTSGAASIDFEAGTKLFARTGGAISGLQGTMLRDTLLSSARAYKIEAPMDITGSINAEIVDSFSLGDIFYFVANEALVGDATLSYKNIEGTNTVEQISKDNSVSLMLVSKGTNELHFKKLSETENRDIREQIAKAFESIEEVEEKLDGHIEDSQKHLGQGDRELLNDIQKLLPLGTDNQVMLGSGKKTLYKNTYDAASSLFNTAAVLGKDIDYLYCQKGDRSIKVRWRDLVLALAWEFVNGGLIPSPPDVLEIESVSLSIEPPVNGTEPNTEVGINDSDPNYEASEIMWEPLGIVNSTQTYTASFSIFPVSTMEDPYEFAEDVEITVNGTSPASVVRETSGALNIAMVFPPTMAALPIPSLSIAEPAFGANRPSEAVQNDDGKDNYENSIIWTPPGATFPAGVSTGDFSLIAKPDYRWNAAEALLNNNAVPSNDAALSTDGMRLNIIHRTASLQNPYQGTFIDPRDGNSYGYKLMPDGRIWMTENLDYSGSGGLYYNNAANPPFAKAGRLYTYTKARAAAPAGWHLPSDAEWTALMTAVGGFSTAGTKLKANHTWNSYSGIPPGTDNYGFSALPGGYKEINNVFSGLNQYGHLWTSTEDSSTDAYFRGMGYNNEYLGRILGSKSRLCSVRYVKD